MSSRAFVLECACAQAYMRMHNRPGRPGLDQEDQACRSAINKMFTHQTKMSAPETKMPAPTGKVDPALIKKIEMVEAETASFKKVAKGEVCTRLYMFTHVLVFTHTFIHMFTHRPICMSSYMPMRTWLCAHGYAHGYAHGHAHGYAAYTCRHIHAHTCLRTCADMSAHVYTHAMT